MLSGIIPAMPIFAEEEPTLFQTQKLDDVEYYENTSYTMMGTVQSEADEKGRYILTVFRSRNTDIESTLYCLFIETLHHIYKLQKKRLQPNVTTAFVFTLYKRYVFQITKDSICFPEQYTLHRLLLHHINHRSYQEMQLLRQLLRYQMNEHHSRMMNL